jgi:aryl-alcohol dehydrogenase-like predicted oxidoreductase
MREFILTPQNIDKVKQLQPIASELGCTMAQLALAWCLKNPNVSTVITGATRPEQVVENMKAPGIVSKLDSEVTERIDKVLGNKPVIEED